MSKFFKPILILLSAITLLTSCAFSPDSYQTDFISMDTYISFTVYGKNAKNAAESAKAETKRLEALLSVTDPDSETSKINAAGGQTVEISGDTANVIFSALSVSELTGGALDITLRPVIKEWGFTTGEYKVPTEERLEELLEKVDYRAVDLESVFEKKVTVPISVPEGFEIDLGAVAKGYAGDMAIDALKKAGITSALVNFGGNVQTLGAKPDGKKWRVAVQSPFDESSFGVIDIENKAVVTSGGYERYFEDENGVRYHHIIDPKTGYPAESGLASVTIVGELGSFCDGMSTAAFVMGAEKAGKIYGIYQSFDMILVTEDGKILITEGIADCFENRSDMEVEIIKKV